MEPNSFLNSFPSVTVENFWLNSTYSESEKWSLFLSNPLFFDSLNLFVRLFLVLNKVVLELSKLLSFSTLLKENWLVSDSLATPLHGFIFAFPLDFYYTFFFSILDLCFFKGGFFSRTFLFLTSLSVVVRGVVILLSVCSLFYEEVISLFFFRFIISGPLVLARNFFYFL